MPKPTTCSLPILVLLSLFWLSLLGAHETKAEELVFARLVDQTRSRLGHKARSIFTRELAEHGLRFTSLQDYLRRAKSLGMSYRKAFRPRSIRRLSTRLGLDGVVTGSVRRRGRTFEIRVRLHDPAGSLVFSKKYLCPKNRLRPGQAQHLVESIQAHFQKRRREAWPSSPDRAPALEEIASENQPEPYSASGAKRIPVAVELRTLQPLGERPHLEDSPPPPLESTGWGTPLAGLDLSD